MRWAIVSVFLALLLLPPAAALADDGTEFAPISIGGAAPEFAEKDIFGRHLVDLEAYRGKVVMLNFWATWCAPCRREIPALESLQSRYKGRLVVIGASVFCSNTDTELFFGQYKINYVMIYGSYDLMGKYGKVFSIPTTFLIDKNGKIAARLVGSRTEVEYYRLLDPLLAE